MNELSKLTLLDETEVYLRDDAALHEVSKEIEGNPIAFSDGTDTPLVNCRVSVSSRQDLHGYDKPWVGGAGKNKLPMVLADIKSANTSGTWSGNAYTLNGVTFTVMLDGGGNVIGIKINGTANAGTTFNLCGESAIDNGTYKINGDSNFVSGTRAFSILYDTSGSVDVYGTEQTVSITTKIRDAHIYIWNGVQNNGLIFYPMIRLSTESDSSFSPYSNICPISGYDEVEIEGSSGNLIPVDGRNTNNGYVEHAYIKEDGSIVSYDAEFVSEYFEVVGGNTYNVRQTTDLNNAGLCFYDKNKQYISGAKFSMRTSFTVVAPNNAKFCRCTSFYYNETPWWETFVTFGDTTYTISLGSTRYGGELDVSRGVLRVTHKLKTFNGSETWYEDSRWANTYYTVFTNDSYTPRGTGYATSALTNKYTPREIVSPTLYANGEFNFNTSTITSSNASFMAKDERFTTVSDFKTALASENLELCYPLATPLEISLTPTQVRSLLGSNYMSCNSGDLSVEYITEDYQPLLETTKKQIYEELPFTIKNGKLHVIYNK